MNSQKPAADPAAVLILAHELLHEIGVPACGDIAERVARYIDEAMSRLIAEERERCVAICKRRAALWGKTPMATSPGGREESRARANEATYLADALRMQ